MFIKSIIPMIALAAILLLAIPAGAEFYQQSGTKAVGISDHYLNDGFKLFLGSDGNVWCFYDEDVDDRGECGGEDLYFANSIYFGAAVYLPDDIYLYFGDGNDLGIRHSDGDSENQIASTGNLKVTSTAGIDLEATNEVGIDANGTELHTIHSPFGYVSATAFEMAGGGPFGPLTSVGIEGGGQAYDGSAAAYIGIGDAADVLRFSFVVPETAILGDADNLYFEFEIHEQASEELNIDVRIIDYGASAVVTDTIVIADSTAKGWVSLVTASTGVGDVLLPGNPYLIELTATADTDDFNIYGVRVTYKVGFDNNG